jgi:hypothetical protein
MLAAAGALAIGGTYAKAANVGVTPTKLIIVDKGASGAKAVFVAKDAAIDKGTGTDTTTISVTLDMAYDNSSDSPTSGQFVAPEGSANWLVNKTTVAKYVNKTAPTGGGAKVVVVKPGNLGKLVGKNLGDTPINILGQSGAATGVAHTSYNISDSGTGFDTNFCSTFPTCAWKSIAGGTGAKVVCKGGSPDPSCAASTPPPPHLSFRTGAAGGTCGHVKSGGTSGTTRKNLSCGGLNVGGGNSTVAEGPTPSGAETQMNIAGGPIYTVSGRTSAESGSNNNCSATGCVFGTYLPISNAGTSTCVQNTFSSGATGTLNSTTGDFTGSFPLTSAVYLTANGTDPCPRCTGGTVGVTNSGTCQAGWTSGVGASPTEGDPCTPINASGNNYDCAPPPAALLPSFPVNLTPITTGTASFFNAGGLFCPSQANAGAFGCGNPGAPSICPGAPYTDIAYIDEVGSPSGPVTTNTPSTLASVFCIPSVGGSLGFLINSAANLPGPGATSLPGTLSIVP